MILRNLISKNLLLTDLMEQLSDEILNHNVNGITSNSKQVQSGYIFIAIKGKKFNGENFIQEAKNKGAFLILSENENLNTNDCLVIRNNSARLIYSILLSAFYNKQPNVIIGITDTLIDLGFSPTEIQQQARKPDELDYYRLTERISELKGNGVDTVKWEVTRYIKISFAFTNLIVILCGIPLVVFKERSSFLDVGHCNIRNEY